MGSSEAAMMCFCKDRVIEDGHVASRAKKRLNFDLSVSNKKMGTGGHMVRTFVASNARLAPTMKAVRQSKGRTKDNVCVSENDVV